MLTFSLAILLMLITPGPGVLTTAGVGAGFGWRHGMTFLAGLFVGTNLVAVLVVTGLAAIVLANPLLRNILLALSVSYLLFLAFKVAFSGAKIGFMGTPKPPGFVGGIMLQLINPKAYVFNTTFFTGFSLALGTLKTEIAIKFLIINAIWIPIHVLWLAAGVSLNRLDLAPTTQRAINIAMALAMLVVVALAAMREF